jgi:copper chaperone CopZ
VVDDSHSPRGDLRLGGWETYIIIALSRSTPYESRPLISLPLFTPAAIFSSFAMSWPVPSSLASSANSPRRSIAEVGKAANVPDRATVSLLGSPGSLVRGGRTVPDIHLYINQPPEEDVPAFEGLADVVKRLEHVSEAKANPTTRVVAVTFTGGRAEQQEIERAIKETGYEVSRRSVRTDYPRE